MICPLFWHDTIKIESFIVVKVQGFSQQYKAICVRNIPKKGPVQRCSFGEVLLHHWFILCKSKRARKPILLLIGCVHALDLKCAIKLLKLPFMNFSAYVMVSVAIKAMISQKFFYQFQWACSIVKCELCVQTTIKWKSISCLAVNCLC